MHGARNWKRKTAQKLPSQEERYGRRAISSRGWEEMEVGWGTWAELAFEKCFLFIWLCQVLVVVHGLSSLVACGIFAPRSGIKPRSPALQGGLLTTGPPGKSPELIFSKAKPWDHATQPLSWGSPLTSWVCFIFLTNALVLVQREYCFQRSQKRQEKIRVWVTV